jgi:hypothetical protein
MANSKIVVAGKEVKTCSIKNGLLAKVAARLESEQKSPRPYPDYHDCFVFDSF